jgi:hypothetical protein
MSTAMEAFCVASGNSYVGANVALLESDYGYRPTDSVTEAIDTVDVSHYEIRATSAAGGTLLYNSQTALYSTPP